MKFAVIARPPVVGGKLVSFDATEALKVPGVEKVVEVQGWPWPSKFMPVGGVAVVARNTGCAIKGRDKLKVVWDNGPNATYDSAAFRQQMEQTAASPGKVVRNDGDAEGALKSAAKVVTARVLHSASGARQHGAADAVVHVVQGKAGTRMRGLRADAKPRRLRDDLAKLLGIPVENVTVNVTLLGGGFGRKSKWDYVLEAALLSKATGSAGQGHLDARGRYPARLLPHRVGRADRCRDRCAAARSSHGGTAAWRRRSSRRSRPGPITRRRSNSAWGWWTIPSPSPTCAARTASVRRTPASAGSARSPTSRTRFAVQSMVAEIAAALGRDPKDVLLELLGPDRIVDPRKSAEVADYWNYGDPFETYPIDTGRLRRVAELAAEQAGWGRQLPKGEGLGIAVHRSFLSYVATVVACRRRRQGNADASRGWTPRSTAASTSIRSASARRSKARR